MLIQSFKYFVAVMTIVTGLASLFWPSRILGFTGLLVVGGRGITEVRAVLGAVFVGFGASVLYFNSPETFKTLGITYLVMAIVRVISIFVDDSLESSNTISVLAELVFGIILVL